MTLDVELWLRPWARFSPAWRRELKAESLNVPSGHVGPVYLYHRSVKSLTVNGDAKALETVAHMTEWDASGLAIQTTLSLLPLSMRKSTGHTVQVGSDTCHLSWPEALERPRQGQDPQTLEEQRALKLMLRAEAVWDRIRDVEDALSDPAQLWGLLSQRWTELNKREPQMDVIVRHERHLRRVLDTLEKRPRRILRRVHRHLPIGRVQEMDRKTMLWLARQPGETLAERAGDNQKVLGVAREENLDTLENRVLRVYGELASRHAHEYLERNRTKRNTRRAESIEAYGKRCARLARALADKGVRRAEQGCNPNFVLQQNAHYHDVWEGWLELQNREREKDELWRWQARSWDEFCSLALVIGLMRVQGAQLVATAPLWFRDEQRRGRWIDADSPLAVIFLRDPGLIVEVQTGLRKDQLGSFAAPLWLRIGRAGDVQGFLSNIAVWPLWSPSDGLVAGEAEEVRGVLRLDPRRPVSGGLLIRPAASADDTARDVAGNVLAMTLGTEGPALTRALEDITAHIAKLLAGNKL